MSGINLTDPTERAQLLASEVEVAIFKREVQRAADAREQPARVPLKALTVGELLSTPAPDYIIDGWLPQRSLCELVGPSDSLKSFFMAHVGLTIASGKANFFGHAVVKHGPVLYVAAEGGGSFGSRVSAWCHEHRVDPLNVPFRVIRMPINLRDTTCQQEILAMVKEINPVLIVIDTLARSLPGTDENSSMEMGEAISFCTSLTLTAAVVFIHHPPKAKPTGTGRGSGALFAAADVEMQALAAEPNMDGSRSLQIACVKQKDDIRPRPLDLTAYSVPVHDLKGRPMANAAGRPMTSLVLRLATEAERNAAPATETGIDADILRFLTFNPGRSKEEIRLFTKKGKAAIHEAVERLVAVGRVALDGNGGTRRSYRAVTAGEPELEF